MPTQNVARLNFNRGRVSRKALSRTDIERVELSAEIQTNYVPRILGSMMVRPGLEYIDTTLNNAEAWHIPFVKSTDDTALVEFTDLAVRFRHDEDIVTRVAVTAQTTDSGFDGTDAISNVTISSGAPSEAQLASEFSPDGTIFCTGQVNTPFIKRWSVSGTTFTALSNPASLPSGQVNGIAFNAAGTFCAVAIEVSPYVEVYSISGTTFTKLGALTAAAGAGKAVAFSDDGLWLSLAHTTTPFLTNYSISGSTFTKQSNPAALPTGNGTGVSWRVGSTHVAVSHATTPFVTAYSVSGSTFTKIVSGDSSQFADAADLPAGNATGISFNPAVGQGSFGLLAVSHTTTPFFSLYIIDDSAGTYTKSTNVGTLPDGNGQCVKFSPDGLRMVVGHATSQFLTLYHVDPDQASRLVVETNPGTLPADSVDAVAFSPLGQMMAACTTGTPYLNMYVCQPWIDYDQSGTTSSYFGGINGTRLLMSGSLFQESRRAQGVYIPVAGRNVEHALDITVSSGPMIVRLGSTFQGTELFQEVVLEEGYYSLAFTPTSSFIYIYFASNTQYFSGLNSVAIASAGALQFVSPYAVTDLPYLRYAQSGDVIFLACKDIQQYKLQHRGDHSWSLVKYQPEDGPFRPVNTSNITITPSALTGQVTLTASRPLFETTSVGSLIRLTSIGQQSSDSFTGANQFAATEIRVTGVGTARSISITRSGTWSATVTLQRSISAPGAWTDVATFTTNATSVYTDGLDNQVIYYRVGIKTGDYTSGTAVVGVTYESGGLDGIARINFYTSSTSVFANVLKPLGSLVGTESWEEGVWSNKRGWPGAVVLHESRLWWAGNDKIFGSASDDYENFDDTQEGDDATIERSIGEGPVDDINWLLALQRMMVGAEGTEFSAKSNSFDEPLTPSNFTLKSISTHGSAAVSPLKIDDSGLFVHRNGERLMQINYDVDKYDYATVELTRLIPEICAGGIRRIGVQRLPDTRIHCVKNDGTVAVLLFDRVENVNGWVDVTTDGIVEDVVVLPDTPEDAVYYVVKRTINSVTKRYLEKWALEEECIGGTLNKQLDSFMLYSGVATTTITGLGYLEAKTVAVWGNGAYLGTYTVSGGSISSLSASVTSAVIGLQYTAQYKSTKLAYAAAGGTALTKTKKVKELGLIAEYIHHYGTQFGPDFNNLRNLPSEGPTGAFVDADEVHDQLDFDLIPFADTWSTDSRICIQTVAPYPATIMGVIFEIHTNG